MTWKFTAEKQASFTDQADDDEVRWRHRSLEQHIPQSKATFEGITLAV